MHQRRAFPRVDVQWGESDPIPEQINPSEAGWPSIGQPGSLTYEPYYGLREKPFSLSADPRFLYKSRSHALAFNDLLAAIRRREGLIVLTGDIGTGKTTLCRSVLAHLDRKTFSSFVPDPFMSREDLLKMLLIDFGVMSIEDLKSGRLRGASRLDLSYPLYEFLNSLVPLEAFAVLVIDEAQNLSLPLLEEMRILSDLEGREKLLQVVLVGQLELHSQLKLPQMRQVDQRVSMRCQLAPLRRQEVAAYVSHRLNVASGGYWNVGFSPDALDEVYHASGGVPRLINLICDRALQRGCLDRTNRIEAAIVLTAIAELGLSIAELSTATEPVVNRKPFVDANSAALRENSAAFPREIGEQAPRVESVESTADPLSEWPTESQNTILRSFEPEHERAGPRTARTLTLAATMILTSLVGVMGGSFWYVSSSASRDAALPVLPPAPPSLWGSNLDVGTDPARPRFAAVAGTPGDSGTEGTEPYLIQVASFESSLRALRLVDELTKEGYVAHQRDGDLGESGHFRRVLVGAYGTRAEAESDLERIREIPGYGDAQLILDESLAR